MDDAFALRLVIQRSQAPEVVSAKQPQALLAHLFLALFVTGWRVDTEETEQGWSVASHKPLPGRAAAFVTPGQGFMKRQQDQLYLRCASRRLSPKWATITDAESVTALSSGGGLRGSRMISCQIEPPRGSVKNTSECNRFNRRESKHVPRKMASASLALATTRNGPVL